MPQHSGPCNHPAALLALLGVLAAAAPAGAGERAPAEAWTMTVLFENDLFGDTDERYTNGLQVSWVSPDLSEYRDSERLPQWALPIVARLPFINEPGLQRNLGFVLGQKMFTPTDIRRRSLDPDDRPYAGWLYFGTAFHNKNPRRLDTFELQLGIVGPAALAEEAQNLVHELRGIPRARGWSNQLDNEPGLMLIYERKQRVLQLDFGAGLGFDTITHAGITVGNVQTHAAAGLETRLGWRLPSDFGTSLIRPGGEGNAPSDASDPRLHAARALSFHVYAAFSGRAIARNIFLDGNTFSDSHSIDKKHLVGDFIIGAAATLGRWKLSYAQVFRSEEFDGQPDASEFGSISLSYTF